MRYEESFGVVPLARKNGQWEVFLIQHRHARYWGFPKGHKEKGEAPEEAAFRELKEETNLDFVRYLRTEPFIETYRFLSEGKQISKRVTYFVAEVGGNVNLQAEEIGGGTWVPMNQAIEQVTHSEGKEILLQVAKILPSGAEEAAPD